MNQLISMSGIFTLGRPKPSMHFLTSFRDYVRLGQHLGCNSTWRRLGTMSPTPARNFAFSTRSPGSCLVVPFQEDRYSLGYSSLLGSGVNKKTSSPRHDFSTLSLVASAQTKPSIPEHTGVDTLPPQSSATKRRERVLLMMSGGVDSSVSAHILQKQGYDVTGLYMHNWNHDQETQDETPSHPIHGQKGHSNIQNSTSTAANVTVNGFTPRTAQVRPKVCTSDRDWADVQAVCSQLGIPARRLDFSRQYWNQVFEIMLDGYRQGRTPNPDVSCNREIKFGKLIEWCQMNGGLGKDRPKEQLGSESSGGVVEYSTENVSTQGWDYLATGHYARVEIDPETGHAKLKRAHDSNKDQTYYLSTLPEKVLRHVLFPLAAIDKPIVKQIASQTGVQQLENAAMKKESMGICFVGKRRRFGEFLQEYLEGDPGPVRVNSLNGPIIGQHKGLYQYTIGQASGVTNGSQKWVVLRPDLASNTLIVVDGTQNKRLFFPGLIAESWHWIAGHPPKKLAETSESTGNVTTDLFPFTAQIRHRQVPQPCTIEPVHEELDHTNKKSSLSTISAPLYRVRFKDLQRAIAPGQQIVIYDGDECLGGAVIKCSLPSPAEGTKSQEEQ